jgi:predicted DNA-binding protein YlxM (UPF0122 family)
MNNKMVNKAVIDQFNKGVPLSDTIKELNITRKAALDIIKQYKKDERAKSIIKLYNKDVSISNIASEFDLCQGTIIKILNEYKINTKKYK